MQTISLTMSSATPWTTQYRFTGFFHPSGNLMAERRKCPTDRMGFPCMWKFVEETCCREMCHIYYPKHAVNNKPEVQYNPGLKTSDLDNVLHGPATLKMDRQNQIVYPCEDFKCKIYCPCSWCQLGKGVCVYPSCKCTKNFNDHILYHHTLHALCKYCRQLFEIFPYYTYDENMLRGGRNSLTRNNRSVKFFIFRHKFECFNIPAKSVESECESFECEICSEKFECRNSVKRHVKTVHFMEKVTCELCGMKLSSDKLKRHERTVHRIQKENSKDASSFKCDMCGYEFFRKDKMNNHMKKRKFECSVCNDQFCFKKNLDVHLHKKHEGHKCESCGATFTRRDNLKRHIEDAAISQCDLCSSLFCNEQDLKSHKHNVHK